MNIRKWVRPLVIAGGLASIGLVITACTGMTRDHLVQSTACADFSFPVYFKVGSDQLTTEAVQLIAESASRAKSCPMASLTISGLNADRPDLATRRADAVTRALAANGLAAPTQVPSTTAVQGMGILHRRAEVAVHFAAHP
jgi:outer membrane protein OmpA-like peptidoglycan-associated protein